MQIFEKGFSLELKKGQAWWNGLNMNWKMAMNEAAFGKGPTIEPPHEEELILLLVRATALRFAGPLAPAPNHTQSLDNLSALSGLTHLTYLSFTHSNVTSLKPLRGLTKMRNLFVYENKLTALDGIEPMTNLEELYCLHNQITSLLPISKLTNLHTLYISYNAITSLEGITARHADKLRTFYCEPNDALPHREIIRIQNEYGILARRG